MCGIVGYVGEKDAGPILLDCLKRLEYRGYDSAGIGVITEGRVEVRRNAGKIVNLERALEGQPLHGSVGVAHTRWATHGRPCDANAHPHSDCTGSVAVVHNGIIENYRHLRSTLEGQGHRFASETDTEVVAHLMESAGGDGLEAAVRRSAGALRGAYALGIISQQAPDTLVGVCNGGPPLVVGLGRDGHFLASDMAALLAYTREVVVLEDGEMAVLSRDGVRLRRLDGGDVQRSPLSVPWDASAAEKSGFRHFMLKEIHEQPRALIDTWRGRLDLDAGDVRLPEARLDAGIVSELRRVVIVACGTSFHAALVGKHMIETLARMPVEVDLGSEYRYRPLVADDGVLTLAISQSGETADTLGAMKAARRLGSRTMAICNVLGSTISREADGVLYTRAGPEVGVASTKAFTTQLVALYLLAIRLGRARGTLSAAAAHRLLVELTNLPGLAGEILARQSQLRDLACRIEHARSVLYLGRGIQYPLALEGALKLKEISYIHAEGYAAGEMKHGPIALIEEGMPVVAIAPQGSLYEKTLGNIEEVKAREGCVIALASEGDAEIGTRADHVFHLPRTSELLLPMLMAVPLQLLAYHAAVLRHCDVDQPRNLAKSVTVE